MHAAMPYADVAASARAHAAITLPPCYVAADTLQPRRYLLTLAAVAAICYAMPLPPCYAMFYADYYYVDAMPCYAAMSLPLILHADSLSLF